MLPGTITIYRDPRERYYFTLRNYFDEFLFRSVSFSAKSDCLLAISRLKERACNENLFSRHKGATDFILHLFLAEFGVVTEQCIFKTPAEREKHIQEIKSALSTANVEDLSFAIRYFRRVNQSDQRWNK